MSLPTSSGSFHLSNVLHIPSMRKNLLSVAKFTKDNSVSFTFYPWGFSINDLHSGSPLFQGRCEHGLFPLAITTSPQALTTSRVSSTLWHHRLGHPSLRVLSTLANNNLLGSSPILLQSELCKTCVLSKSTRAPFSTNETKASVPFALIHSDVWMSPVSSTTVYCYYVIFTDDFSWYS